MLGCYFFKLLCLSFVCHIVCWSIETRDLLIRAPPVTFPRVDGKIKKIEMPEDLYVKVLQKASRFALPRCNQVSSLSCALWFPCKNLPLQHCTVEIVYIYLRLQNLKGRAKCCIVYLFPLHMQMVLLSKFVSFWIWILIHIRSFQDKRIWSATSTSFCMACLGVERARSQWRLCDGCSRCKNPILKMSFY